jgi:hypothetical protein
VRVLCTYLQANYYGAWAAGPMLSVKLHGSGSEARVQVINRGTRDTIGTPHIALVDGQGKVKRQLTHGEGVLRGKAREPRSWDTGLSLDGVEAMAGDVKVLVWDDMDCAVFTVDTDLKSIVDGASIRRLATADCAELMGDVPKSGGGTTSGGNNGSGSSEEPRMSQTPTSAPSSARPASTPTRYHTGSGNNNKITFEDMSPPPLLLWLSLAVGVLLLVHLRTNVFRWFLSKCVARNRTREVLHAGDEDYEDGDGFTDDEYGGDGGFGDVDSEVVGMNSGGDVELVVSSASSSMTTAARSAEYAALKRSNAAASR